MTRTSTTTETVAEIQKSQELRLWDMFFLGPILVYAGSRKSNLPAWLRGTLVASGVLVVAYNGSNWLENRRRMKA